MMQVVWIPANGAMLILFLSIFVPHFENIFIHFPNAQQEQRNKRIFLLLFYHMIHCYTCGLHSIPLLLKCHHHYQQFIRNVDKKKTLKCCQWKYLSSSLKFGMNSFYQISTLRMGDEGSNPKNVSFIFAPNHMYWEMNSEKGYFWQHFSPLRTLHLATISLALVSIQYLSFKGVLLCFSVQFCILWSLLVKYLWYTLNSHICDQDWVTNFLVCY